MTYNSAYPQKDKRIIEVTRGLQVPPLLFDLLSCPSPHGLEDHIYNMLPCKTRGYRDEVGNFIVKVGEAPTILFSCHMDTVHNVKKEFLDNKTKLRLWLLTLNEDANQNEAGIIWAGIRQNPQLHGGMLKYEPAVLGADDKLGCYIMCEMIDHDIPGLYIFHVGEEVGGVGSTHIKNKTPDLLKGIQHAIAFDRMNTTDIICSQRGGKCASSEFADEFAKRLNLGINTPKNLFRGGVTGTFTDTANYRELVPECTNISVGYANQHTERECFDMWWLETKLLPTLLTMDWTELPVKRDPKEPAYQWTGGGYHYSNYYVSPKDVNAHTAWANIPPWDPTKGLFLAASHEGMIKIAEKYFGMARGPELAKIFVPYMSEHMLLELDHLELQDKFKDLQKLTKKLLDAEKLNEEEIEALADLMPEEEPVTPDPAKEEPTRAEALEAIDKALPALPAPSMVSSKSAIIIHESTDRDLFPSNADEYRKRVAHKMAIITGIMENQRLLKLDGPSLAEFARTSGKFKSIASQIGTTRDGLRVSRKVYKLLGEILCYMVETVENTNNSEALNNTLLTSYQEGLKYIGTYYYEPGITVAGRA